MELEHNELEQVEQHVQSYLNGNIAQFKEFLRNCSKIELLDAVTICSFWSKDTENNVMIEFKSLIDW